MLRSNWKTRIVPAGLVVLAVACGGQDDEPTALAREHDAVSSRADGPPASSAPTASRDEAPDDDPAVGFLDREAGAQIRRVTAEFTGDLDEIRERRLLRVLVNLDRTSFFVADGKLRGFEYEMFHELAKQLDAQRTPGDTPLEIVYLPLPFDELIDALLAGEGDVVAASLAVTPERRARVAFTGPYMEDVQQVLVAHESAERPGTWEELSGRTVHVVAGTSHAELLAAISERFVGQGARPIDVVHAPRGLTTEDLLDLVAEGTLDYTVVDDYVAELWASHQPALRVVSEVASEAGDDLAWAVRPDNPQLKTFLDEHVRANRKGTMIGNILYRRYFENADWLRNPLTDLGDSRLGPLSPAFQRYSEEYGFDWRLMAAQAYQESRLDPDAVSRSGAVGLMQLLPSTAADMGFTDLRDPETNVHAGIKYMAWIRDNFFGDADLSPEVAVDFALASYNAGPSRVRRWPRAPRMTDDEVGPQLTGGLWRRLLLSRCDGGDQSKRASGGHPSQTQRQTRAASGADHLIPLRGAGAPQSPRPSLDEHDLPPELKRPTRAELRLRHVSECLCTDVVGD